MCHYYDNLQGRHTEICTHTHEGSVQEHLGTDRNPVRKPRVCRYRKWEGNKTGIWLRKDTAFS